MTQTNVETDFSKWLGAISFREYKQVREDLIRATGVTPQAFRLWENGKKKPSLINDIRIAYYAVKNGIQAYKPGEIKPDHELITDKGIQYIHALLTVSKNLTEDRYVVYVE